MADEQPRRNRDAIDRDLPEGMTRAGIGHQYHDMELSRGKTGQTTAKKSDQ